MILEVLWSIMKLYSQSFPFKATLIVMQEALSYLYRIELNTNHDQADDEPNDSKGWGNDDHDLHGAQVQEGWSEGERLTLTIKSKFKF